MVTALGARYIERAYVGDETMGHHQAYESLVAHTAMVYDSLKILIYDRVPQRWYLLHTQKSSIHFPLSAGCWKDLVKLAIHKEVVNLDMILRLICNNCAQWPLSAGKITMSSLFVKSSRAF